MKHRAWILALDRFEIGLRSKVAVNRNLFIKQTAIYYEATQQVATHVAADHTRRLANILEKHYLTVMPFFVRATASGLKGRDRRLERKAITAFESFMREWASTEALKKARTIASTDIDEVTNVISKGLLEGSTLAEISKDIRKYSGLSAYRASVVARTETHNAATFATLESSKDTAEQTGFKLTKQWLPTNDKRTRDAHASMSGSAPIPIDEKFTVDGETMDRPGDPAGGAGNVINCRCQILIAEQ